MQEMQADTSSIPGLGRFPEGGHGNPLQYSYLENLMNRGAWQATLHLTLFAFVVFRDLLSIGRTTTLL